ncbi:MAG TPA: hypothetical protein VER11_20630 [Polyangiaceae bacterium]|nr:hypothetical protein [Polyangiaceae bacterium]
MKNSVSLLAMLSVVWFLVGWGSCASRVPVTTSADSPTEGSDPESVQPADPDAAGRLQNCAPGTADCDRDPSNDCEAVLADDARNCGVCGVQCDVPHANSGCLGGTCRVISCTPGFCDSDKDPENGCETPAKTCHP